MLDKKNLLKKIFADVFESPDFDFKVIQKHFHPDYTQCVDGKTLHFDQFVEHMKALKASIKEVKVSFEHLIAEDNSVCSIHYPEGVKSNGQRIKAKVIALFKFKDLQLIFCDELTQLIVGEKEDRDLGSRQ